jgi:alkylation response protein AidB-like acyl-CoA dehydrogenase
MTTASENPVLDMAARLFADLYDHPPALRPSPIAFEDSWAALEAAGLPRAGADEAQGGVGLAAAEVFALIRLCGLHAVPAPLAESLLATWLWSRDGGTAGGVADGLVTLAAPSAAPLRLTRTGAGYRADGSLLRVPWGRKAALVLAEAEFEGRPALILAPCDGVAVTPAENLAREPRDDLVFAGAAISPDRVLLAPRSSLRHLGALMRAAGLAGAAAGALERSIGYAGERVQFGRPIGKFQAVQQQLAVAAGEAAASGAVVDLAVALIEAPSFTLAAAAAKARTSEAAGRIAAICHQVHAAIAFTNEYPLQIHTKRLWSWREEHGAEIVWQQELGARLLAEGSSGAWPFVTAVSPRA